MPRDESTTDDESFGRRKYLSAASITALGALGGCIQGSSDDGSGGGNTESQTSSSDGDDNGEIVFGQPAALTGKWANIQGPVNQAMDMTVSEVNAAGGPLDRQIKLKRRDTGVNPQTAREVVQQLVDNDNAAVINGLFSSEVVALYDFLNEMEVPVVDPWPGTRFLSDKGGDNNTPKDLSDDGWVWRTIISDSVHTAGAALRMKDAGATKVGVLNGTSGGSRSWANGFTDAVAAIDNLEVAKRVEVQEGKNSYTSELSRLFNSDFDMWGMAVGEQDAITILREYASAGYEPDPIISDGLKTEAIINTLGDNLPEGVLLTAGASTGPAAEKFKSLYAEEYGDDARLNPWAIASYDAVNVSALAIHRGGSADPKEIEKNIGPVGRGPGKKVTSFAEGKEALNNGEKINYQGTISGCDFTGNGNVVGKTQVWKVTQSGFKDAGTIPRTRVRDVLTSSDYGQN